MFRMQKYVALRTLEAPLPWMNSTLLKGEAAETVAEIKAQEGPDMMVMGSGDLVQTLMEYNLVDQHVLLIHPLVFGSGRRLFVEGGPSTNLRLVDAKATPSGVVVAAYSPNGSSGQLAPAA